MRIVDFSIDRKNTIRASARVIWEDCDRPEQTIYFETLPEFSSDFTCNPEAFLIAGLLPALKKGERRIALTEPVCPQLLDNLRVAVELVRSWRRRGIDRSLVIEATPLQQAAQTKKGAASLLSGGIDSLCTLWKNRTTVPRDHPASIKTCLTVLSPEIESEIKQCEGQVQPLLHVRDNLSNIAKSANVTLIPIFSNVRSLEEAWVRFWPTRYQAAAQLAPAHLFAKRISLVSIASSMPISAYVVGFGSHPLLDPLYGSYGISVRHDGTEMTRLEKCRFLRDWDDGLRNLKVCNGNFNESGKSLLQSLVEYKNCGRCDKCILTMVELEACGVLHKATFPTGTPLIDLISRIVIKYMDEYTCFTDTLAPLAARGQDELVTAIQNRLELFEV
jgi:hypothetical protein